MNASSADAAFDEAGARLLSTWRAAAVLALVAGCLAGQRAARCDDRLFHAGQRFPIEGHAEALALADYDGDGRQDLAILGMPGVSVLLSDPQRTFRAQGVYAAGAEPSTLVAGDLNNDGAPDIVVANTFSSTLSVLLNLADGSFGAALEYPMGEPRAISLDDFDVDGDLDIASSNLGSGHLEIGLGDGLGGFVPGEALDVGSTLYSFVSGDFDSDSIADFVVAHSKSVGFFRGRGDGTFEAGVETMVPAPLLLAAGEFLGERRQDLAVITFGGPLLALENLGGGRFRQEEVDILTGSLAPFYGYGYVAVTDLDTDGIGDVIVLDTLETENVLRTYRTLPGGAFVPAPPVHLDGIVRAAVGDVTADGIADMMAARLGLYPATVTLLRGLAPGRPSVRSVLPIDGRPLGLVELDLDGQEPPDVVAFTSDSLHLVPARPGGFEDPVRRDFAGSGFVDMASGDFDGEGTQELALADLARNEARVVFLERGMVSARAPRHPLRGLPSRIIAGDFDADGWSDLVAGDQAQPKLLVIFRPGDESGASILELEAGRIQKSLAASDLDGDGFLDIAASTHEGVRLFFGDGRRGFPRFRDIRDLLNSPEIRAADVDGDGAMDLVGIVLTSVMVLQAPAIHGASRRLSHRFGTDMRSLEVADADRDGRLDLIAASGSAILVARGKPEGSFGETEEYMVGQDPRSILLRDFDSDGALEAVTADYVSRSLSLLHGNSKPVQLFRRGDADATGVVDLSDAVAVLNSLFLGERPLGCPDAADANDDGALNLTDAVTVLLHLFAGGPAPAPPGPGACGMDPTNDELGGCSAPCP